MQFPSFSLDNFEGPLELLLYLIEKEEIDICTIVIKQLTDQIIKNLDQIAKVDLSSEMLSLTATLLLLKSQRLLPSQALISDEEIRDPRIEIIQSLIEYSRLREGALSLSLKEEEQKAFFPRETISIRKQLGNGLEEINLEDLKTILLDLLQKTENQAQQLIKVEEWTVSDQIAWLKELIQSHPKWLFNTLFPAETSRNELIVRFLALLEMMKHQILKIVKEEETLYILRTYDPKT